MAGAAIFYYIESNEEYKRAQVEFEERKTLEELLKEHFVGNYSVRKKLFVSLSDYCGKTLDVNMSEDPFTYRWDYYHSLFFMITVVSTIGYGNLAPTTMFTRLFMIFYGLLGIPLNGIVVFTLGEFFGKSFTKLHQRWKNSKLEAKLNYDTAKLGLIGQVILYLVPGFTFFIFLPSTIMTVFEGWEYDVSVYYSFVSLTTIGFGDYVAGVTDYHDFGPLYSVYKIFLLVWIIGGMGYVAMILSFITHALRSKRVKKIEHMLSENIKNTPKKLRAELRSVLREFLFLRVKPVYKGEFEYIPSMIERSQSCPDLTMYKKVSPRMGRKRAMSECYRSVTLQKIQSDSDLNRIDKERTFMPSEELFEQTDLLFKVVNALSCESLQNQQINEGGIHGFSDADILASEYCDPAITQLKANGKKRRAISDIRPPSMLLHEAINGNTWYGADAEEAISEYRKRQRAKSVFEPTKPKEDNIFKKIKNRIISRQGSSLDIEKQKIPNEMERARSETPPNMCVRRSSVMSQPQEQILEQTSIADFIRALSAIATTDSLQDSESLNTNLSPKTRRHGISMMTSRRSSLVPESQPVQVPTRRRFSLKPSEENLLRDVVKKKERKRKVSVVFQDERRSSLLDSSNIPPTLQEHVLYSPTSSTLADASRSWKSTGTGLVSASEETVAPPPYSAVPTVTQRKFSVRPTNLSSSVVSPVQKQLQKRDRTDSTSSASK